MELQLDWASVEPCPHCGSRGVAIFFYTVAKDWRKEDAMWLAIACSNAECGARGGRAVPPDWESAIDKWNKRVE